MALISRRSRNTFQYSDFMEIIEHKYANDAKIMMQHECTLKFEFNSEYENFD